LLISASENGEEWRRSLEDLVPGIDFRIWPDAGAVEDVEMAMVWKAPHGVLAGLPNLRCIASLGQGVDHLFGDSDLPKDVPVVRLVDDSMRRQMTAYVVAAVLRRLCRMEGYAELQRAHRWQGLDAGDPTEFRVGVMGLGALGSDAAEKLVALGFRVSGWSRTAKDIAGVVCFAGTEALGGFLGDCDMVCCLLPLTPETRGILNARAFAAMKRGAYLINSARGGHVVEADLLAALGTGQISGATLDVFETEPLPADHPFWDHPKVTITPHASAVTLVRSSAPQIAENYRRLRAGEPLLNIVDRARQY
jgi:glyoxylate/hydroxypyruvate reductase A